MTNDLLLRLAKLREKVGSIDRPLIDATREELVRLQDDLAAARALLREAITHVNCHAFSSADRLAERIDAALKDRT